MKTKRPIIGILLILCVGAIIALDMYSVRLAHTSSKLGGEVVSGEKKGTRCLEKASKRAKR